jgi:DNA-binding transcriptional MerR regulator
MNDDSVFTIKKLADIAGVSVRTLHYYDQIGLIVPEFTATNGYRYYGKKQTLLLQQVLFFRELGFSLEQIRKILTRPNINLTHVLETHRQTLADKVERLQTLIKTIDHTIASEIGEYEMSEKEFFKGFSAEKQAEYQKYAEEHWDKKLVNQSNQRWKAMNQKERDALLADGEHITLELVNTIPLGPGSRETQELVRQWHAYINRFYDCSYEILLGLGRGYTEHPDFITFYRKIHPAMPEFLYEAIKIYCGKQEKQK